MSGTTMRSWPPRSPREGRALFHVKQGGYTPQLSQPNTILFEPSVS